MEKERERRGSVDSRGTGRERGGGLGVGVVGHGHVLCTRSANKSAN